MFLFKLLTQKSNKPPISISSSSFGSSLGYSLGLTSAAFFFSTGAADEPDGAEGAAAEHANKLLISAPFNALANNFIQIASTLFPEASIIFFNDSSVISYPSS